MAAMEKADDSVEECWRGVNYVVKEGSRILNREVVEKKGSMKLNGCGWGCRRAKVQMNKRIGVCQS